MSASCGPDVGSTQQSVGGGGSQQLKLPCIVKTNRCLRPIFRRENPAVDPGKREVLRLLQSTNHLKAASRRQTLQV